MEAADPGRQVAAFRRQLEAMGLELRQVPGGQSLLGRLFVQGGPFPTLEDELGVPQIVFATVGANRIKCLIPRALFHLPLISVADCESTGALEARIRQTWRKRMEGLRQTREWLEKLGCRPQAPPGAAILTLPLGLEDPEARAAAVEPGAVLLPGRGPLTGLKLERPEDRVFRPDADIASPVDFEIAVSSRLEQLARLAERMERQARLRAAVAEAPAVPEERVPAAQRTHRVLLVGRRLLGDTGLIESLRMRNYRITAVRGAAEALRAFERRSFELALVESDLDRFEGLELVPSLRGLPGIEEIPLVIVDTRLRTGLRETARRVGAAGYVTHPIDVPLIEEGLTRLLRAPRRRRFKRYLRRLGVRASGSARSEVTQEISRGGMLVSSDRELLTHALQRFAIALPDGRGSLRADAEVVYQRREEGREPTLVGLRFHTFPDNDEERLIAFLDTLDSQT
jgi:CheY-like chemotaxis protein